MRLKKNNHSLAMRLAALGLTLVMIIPMLGNFGINAKAATSLNGIEEIKNEKRRLTILEIVPKMNSGSIGYYVGGKEPTANWLDTLALTAGTSARVEYANTLFDKLRARGLMGSGATAYPLTDQGNYTEIMPWVQLEQGGTANSLHLLRSEEQVVQGTVKPSDAGHYVEDPSYAYTSDGSGDYVENVLYYNYGERSGGTTYYYHVVFNRVKLTDDKKLYEDPNSGYVNIEDYEDVPLYVLVQNDGDLPRYQYEGILENGDLTIEGEINEGSGYFTASVTYPSANPISTTWEPCKEVNPFNANGTVNTALVNSLQTLYASATNDEGKIVYTVADRSNLTQGTTYYTQDEVHSYYAVTVPNEKAFRLPQAGETPYFETMTAYRLVGNGQAGDGPYFEFKASNSSKDQFIIKYDTVFYTGGYTNNEWFKNYVLDMEDNDSQQLDAVEIKVNSVTLDRLTKNDIQNADLVVISAGFDLDTGNPIEYEVDIKSDYYDEIIQKPRVVDLNLRPGKSLVLDGFADTTRLTALKDENSALSVTAENVCYFAVETAGENSVSVPLATNLFHTKFTEYASDASVSSNAYEVVVEEIEYENLLRDAAAGGTSTNKLSTEVSLATCFRYVINTHLAINKKTSLRVLDIQPAARYDGDVGPLTVAQVDEANETAYAQIDPGPLTVKTVLNWLPDTMKAQLKKTNEQGSEYYDVTITHMSTNALVGKLEDISEEYDLIYIGAATTPEDQAYLRMFIGSGTNSIDNEYHYANIGAVVNVDDRRLGGILDTDASTMPDNATMIQTRYSGNDLTPGKRDELIEFANAGMPIVLAQQLVNVTNPEEAGKITWSVTLTPDGTSITATPNVGILDTPYEASFEWERWTANSWWEQLFGSPEWNERPDSNYSATGATINNVNPDCRYRCTVTLTLENGKTSVARSAKVSLISESITTPAQIITHPDTSWQNGDGAYAGNESYGQTLGAYTVTVAVDKVRSDVSTSLGYPSYEWRVGLPGGSSSSADLGFTQLYTVNSNNWYYCVITVRYRDSRWNYTTTTLTSPAYRLQPAQTTSTTKLKDWEPGDPGTINNYGAGGTISLEPEAVDPNSKMYEALNSVIERENVMAENQLTLSDDASDSNELAELWIMQQQEVLVKYLNLSRPSLELTGKPAEYDGVIEERDYKPSVNLNYTFKINNPTDATPVQTRYRCYLYIDQNGDGRHSESERIYDFQIKEVEADGTTVSVENGKLRGCQENDEKTYRLTRQLKASQFSGLVAWKLEVVKEGDSTVHASEKGYTYIQPLEPTPVKVLQITNSYYDNTADLSTPYEAEGTEWEENVTSPNSLSAFQKLYRELYNAKMYDITVKTMTVGNLNGASDPFAVLSEYEMIVLGFGDMYGDLDEESAQAVARYIDTGKAVLFTHDTTSIWNREKESPNGIMDWLKELFGTGNFRGYWGYQFNKIIRDKVGLDRYGVTNAEFFDEGIKTGAKGSILPDEAKELEKAGYTVAYETAADSPLHTSSGKNQGFSNLTIARYQANAPISTGITILDNLINGLVDLFSGGGGGGITETYSASQVNRGHITEYPYNLSETLSIGQTHEQYYQLNMNAEDITVWYCLSGSNYANFKNDTVNAYYVYNRGNVTYSGAGHSGLSTDEAELFVNTLIAAYRAGNSAPSVEFKTAGGDNATVQLVPMEFVSQTEMQSLNGQQYIYFEVQDTNLNSDKKVTVTLSYEPLTGSITDDRPEEDTELKAEGAPAGPLVIDVTPTKVYLAETGEEITLATQSLSSGVLYRMAFPPDILTYFAGLEDDDSIKIYLKAITTLKGTGTEPLTYTGFDVLTLQHLGLLRLE